MQVVAKERTELPQDPVNLKEALELALRSRISGAEWNEEENQEVNGGEFS